MRFDGLTTARLKLEPAARRHAAGLLPLFDNWNVVRWLTDPDWPVDAASYDAWIARAEFDNVAGRAAHAIIVIDGAPAGVVDINQRRGARSLGYWLAEPWWGKGVMSEAADALLRWFFAGHADLFVISGAVEGNRASLRVQEKLGFIVVGESAVPSRPLQRRAPHVDTLLGRERWRRLRQRSAAA